MSKTRNSLLLITLLLVSRLASAYPIFYKCGPGDRLDDSFAGPELLEKVQAMLSKARNDGEFDAMARQLCQGAQECVFELERMKKLIGDTQDVGTALLNNLQRMKTQNLAQSINEDSYQDIKSYVDAAYTINACHEIKKTWSADLWTAENGDDFAVYYPKYSNYMYASGCFGRSNAAECVGNKISTYKDKIKSALLMGMDPYLAIALVWMEGGTREGLDYLYLDPIGKFGSMGCTSTPVNSTNAGDLTLDSFGTFYDVHPSVRNNPALTTKLERFLKAKGAPPAAGESYFCRRINDDLGVVYNEPQPDSCCLKVPFKGDSINTELVEEALVFEQARKNYQTRFRGMEDPAFRVQRFNGYSRLMGAAEPVEAFRAGVNHYNDPAYGYQAMDFLVNSILTNPVIHQMVENAEKEVEDILGRKADWRSIMCVEHPGGGTFMMDSTYYFNKHRNTKRLEEAAERWFKDGALTGAEQRLLDLEINTLYSRGIMNDDDLNATQQELYNNYFTNHYPNRSTVGSASVNQSTYTWEDLSDADLRRIGRKTIGR